MSLQAGQRLGPYEIIAQVGAGGMGEVYRSKDTRLDRTVAIKILPEALAQNVELRERFEREAKAISSLNHPNICVLHDIGSEDGVDFLVMEYIEGEALADRLAKGPLPLATALDCGVAIADALYKAHRSGVVHRDLKPGNVMLTPSGIKLLDFGLAKLASAPEPGVDEDEDAPTQNKPLTSAGTVLGTIQYMSPEQLEGREADERADVFAFGALMYEMVTGRRAFEGDSQASLIGAIMNKDPAPMTTLEPLTPSKLEWVIQKCLFKDREERWQSAADLRDALRWVAEPDGEATSAQPTPARIPLRMVVAGMLAAAVVAASWFASGVSRDASTLTHAVISLEPHQAFIGGVLGAVPFSISPDGTVLAYTVNEGTRRHLYIRNLNSFASRRVEPSDGANSPFFSPDGQWVGFFRHDGLFKASAAGGAPVRISDAPAIGYGADWGRNGTIVFASTQTVYVVSEDGGAPEVVLEWSPELGGFRCPRFLPSGDRIFLSANTSGAAETAIVSLETGEWSLPPALTGTGCADYLPNGYLVQDRSGSLWAGRFDVSSLEFTEPSFPVLENLHVSSVIRRSFTSMADSGALVYAVPGPEEPLLWVDRDGRSSPAANERKRYRFPRLDPEDRRAIVSISRSNDSSLWVMNLERGGSSLLGFGNWAAWGPEPSTVTVVALGDGNIIHRLDIDNPSVVTPIHEPGTNVPGAWSRDMSVHAFYKVEAETNRDIWILKPDGTAEPFLATVANERTPYPSPDGARIAYVSDASGRDEVYVRNYPDTGKRWLLSTDGGREPVWSADGTELFFRNGWQMLAVDVRNEEALDRATPRVLFEERYGVDATGLPNYDVSKDGQRFLMVVDHQPTELRVITNWGDELDSRLAEN